MDRSHYRALAVLGTVALLACGSVAEDLVGGDAASDASKDPTASDSGDPIAIDATSGDSGSVDDAGATLDSSSLVDAAVDAAVMVSCRTGGHFACLDFDDGGIPAEWISQYAPDAAVSSWMVTDAASFSPPNSAALRSDERIIFGAWDAGTRTVTLSAKIRLPEGGTPYVLRLLTTNANVFIGGAALAAGADTSGWTTAEGTPEARANIAAPPNVFVDAMVRLTFLSDGGISASMNVGGATLPPRSIVLNQAFNGVAAGIGNNSVNGTVLYDDVVVDLAP